MSMRAKLVSIRLILTVWLCCVFLIIRGVAVDDVSAIYSSVKKAMVASQPGLKRYLMVYYVCLIAAEDSPEVYINNIKVIAAAVKQDEAAKDHLAHYIFNVVGGPENMLWKYLPIDSPKVTVSSCSAALADLQSHQETASALGESILNEVQAVLFLTYEVRGPFEHRTDGGWWRSFTDPFFQKEDKVGLLGAVASCDGIPHVQTHAFSMPGALVSPAFAQLHSSKLHRKRTLEISLTSVVQALGYNIASVLYQRRYNISVMTGDCFLSQGNAQLHSNPTTWCNLKPRETIFMKWGGFPLRNRGFYCQDSIDAIEQATHEIHQQEPGAGLIVSETAYGGPLFPLYKEYNEEVYQDKTVVRRTEQDLARDASAAKVCFIVRSAIMHGRAAGEGSRVVRMDLRVLIQSKST